MPTQKIETQWHNGVLTNDEFIDKVIHAKMHDSHGMGLDQSIVDIYKEFQKEESKLFKVNT